MANNMAHISHVYFVGIGGIGMSAIARHFLHEGLPVYGYDKTATKLTNELEKEGAIIQFKDAVDKIPEDFSSAPKEACLVVYTPAIPKDSAVLNHLFNNGYTVVKRSEALAQLTENHFTIAVAGTHGKTSTCTYLAHILMEANVTFTAFLGGISANYGSNYVVNGHSDNRILVVEADEYDRSFHRLSPNVAVITSIEPDHLDIYGSYDQLLKAYQEFAERTQEGGKIIVHERFSDKIVVGKDNQLVTYGSTNSTFPYGDVRIEDHRYGFNLEALGEVRFDNGAPGIHNIENATAAAAATIGIVPNVQLLQKALSSFKGAKRRFEFVFEDESSVYVDDYAHHPTELKYAIKTAKDLYPNRSLTVVFQPHLFSRTRDLADGFGQELSKADELILMPIYPARELPISGVSSSLILEKAGKGSIKTHEEVTQFVETEKPSLLLTLGAGNIDLLVEPIQSIYQTAKKDLN